MPLCACNCSCGPTDQVLPALDAKALQQSVSGLDLYETLHAIFTLPPKETTLHQQLVERLKAFPEGDIEFVLPQLLQLALLRPGREPPAPAPIEEFMVEVANSPHLGFPLALQLASLNETHRSKEFDRFLASKSSQSGATDRTTASLSEEVSLTSEDLALPPQRVDSSLKFPRDLSFSQSFRIKHGDKNLTELKHVREMYLIHKLKKISDVLLPLSRAERKEKLQRQLSELNADGRLGLQIRALSLGSPSVSNSTGRPGSPPAKSLAHALHGNTKKHRRTGRVPRHGKAEVEVEEVHEPKISLAALHTPTTSSSSTSQEPPAATGAAVVVRYYRILEHECIALSSAAKAPYMIWVESDIEPFVGSDKKQLQRQQKPTNHTTSSPDVQLSGQQPTKHTTTSSYVQLSDVVATTAPAADTEAARATSSSDIRVEDVQTKRTGREDMPSTSSEREDAKVVWHKEHGTDKDKTPATSPAPQQSPTSSAYKKHLKQNKYAGLTPFGELYEDRRNRIAQASPEAAHDSWDLESVIFKAGDDLKQEALAMQMIVLLDQIWREAKIPLLLQPYGVLATSPSSGMIDTVVDANSIDNLKHLLTRGETLADFFRDYFAADPWMAPPNAYAIPYTEAHDNYVRSLAAYSLVTYLLKLRDRHNGNIMLTTHGAVLHIDYGFMLGTAPGGVDFEGADFKLTREYLDIMGRDKLPEFEDLFVRGFLEARKHHKKFLTLVELMQHSGLPCFAKGAAALQGLRDRFFLDQSETQCKATVKRLIARSILHWRSKMYDRFQYATQGIL
eukprot:g15527.t1